MHKTNNKFTIRRRLKSFWHAFSGLFFLIRTQPNAWIHSFAALAVIAAGFHFTISKAEWFSVILSIGLVFAAEAINTAIEEMVDLLSPGHQIHAKRAKDLSAGAVLIISIAAAIIGLIIFVPYFL